MPAPLCDPHVHPVEIQAPLDGCQDTKPELKAHMASFLMSVVTFSGARLPED